MSKKFYDADKGDRFYLFDGDGQLVRGVSWADLENNEYGKLYVHTPFASPKERHRVKVAIKVIRGKFTVEPVTGPTTRRRFLIELIQKNKWKRGAEIGLAKGMTTFTIINECPSIEEYIAVDFWPGKYQRLGKLFMQRVNKKIKTKFFHKLTLIKKPSVEAAEDIEDESLDWVFIDADHSEKSCTEDIEAWVPKVKPGGLISGHDVNWDPVHDAVKKKFRSFKIFQQDNVWYLYKPKKRKSENKVEEDSE